MEEVSHEFIGAVVKSQSSALRVEFISAIIKSSTECVKSMGVVC